MSNETYRNVYYRIKSGYNCGYMSREACDALYNEIRELFTDAGWCFIPGQSSGEGPTVKIGKTELYCHPQSLSGPVKLSLIEGKIVETILAKGKLFSYRCTDIYKEVKDWDLDEYKAWLHTQRFNIIDALLTACKTQRRDVVVNGQDVCWKISNKYFVDRICDRLIICSGNPAHMYTQELFNELVKAGLIERTVTRRGRIGYRTQLTNFTENYINFCNEG